MFYTAKDAERYLESLRNEVEEYYLNEEIKTIYIGGGTPSVLNPNELNKLFEIIKLINKLRTVKLPLNVIPKISMIY